MRLTPKQREWILTLDPANWDVLGGTKSYRLPNATFDVLCKAGLIETFEDEFDTRARLTAAGLAELESIKERSRPEGER